MGKAEKSKNSRTTRSSRAMVHHSGRGFRAFAAIVTTLAIGWALVGCGSSESADSTATSGEGNPSTTASSSPDSDSSSASGTSSTSSPATTADGTCATSQLTATVSTGSGGGAGSLYPYIVLTNHGIACAIGGYPGVSLAASGKQIGAAAVRESGSSTTLTLQRGQSAYSALQITQAANLSESACKPTQADSVVIYPPNQKTSISVANKDFTGCANAGTAIVRVKPLQAGTGQ